MLRRNSTVTDIVSNCAPPGVTMSGFSSYYMLIPYGLWGVSEALLNPAFSDWLYWEAPSNARSFMVAFRMFFCGYASLCCCPVESRPGSQTGSDRSSFEQASLRLFCSPFWLTEHTCNACTRLHTSVGRSPTASLPASRSA